MTSKYREHGRVAASTSWSLGTVTAITLLALFAFIGMLDEQEDRATTVEAQAFAAGEAKARKELAPRIAQAYEQGQRDALVATVQQPDGIELLQVCRALLPGSDLTKSAATRRACLER